jgi:hypothetical protein
VPRFSREPSTDRILVNVAGMGDVVVDVRDATAVIAAFPYIQFAFEAKRKTSFEVLHYLFERDIWGRSQQEMDMVGHDNERMELETFFVSLALNDIEEESCVLFDLKKASAGRSDGSNEVGPEFLWG